MASAEQETRARETAPALRIASSTDAAAEPGTLGSLCAAIGREVGLDRAERERVVAAAGLHDIGKLTIPREVLEKKGPLSGQDWTAIQRHTLLGEAIVRAVPEIDGAAEMVRHAAERWDGSGYPDGLAGGEIPFGSRVIACAVAYQAMLEHRPYREAMSVDAALAELRACAGTQFDPDVVEALAAVAGPAGRRRVFRRR